MAKVRRAAVAGLFYEADPQTLREQIQGLFLHKLGPGKLPPEPQAFSGRVLGAVVPHAGYIYSGPVAAHAYLKLAEAGKPDVVFIVGPNHYAQGDAIALSAADYWETPLGMVKVASDLCRELARRSKVAMLDDLAHLREHSVEVQVPFLQFIFGEDFEIVPLVMTIQYPDVCKVLGRTIAEIITEQGLRAYVLASSDFTHYEPGDVAERKDKAAISKILALDIDGLYNVVVETPVSMCGPGPVMVLMAAANQLDARKVELLKYANSGDVTGDYSQVVGYASILVSW